MRDGKCNRPQADKKLLGLAMQYHNKLSVNSLKNHAMSI